VRYRPRGSQR